MKRATVVILAAGLLLLAATAPALARRFKTNLHALTVMRSVLAAEPAAAGPAPAAITQSTCRLYAAQVRAAPSLETDAAFLERCLELGGDDSSVRLALATMYAAQGQGESAARVLRAGRYLDQWLMNQAQAALDEGRAADAQALLAQAQGWAAWPSSMGIMQARAQAALGDIDGALAAYAESVATDRFAPERSDLNRSVALYEQGRLAADHRRWDVAVESFRRLVEGSPDHAGGWMRLGMAYYSGFADYAAAENALRTSLRLAPVDWAHLWLARVLAATGRSEESAREYLAAYRMNRYEPSLTELLGLLPQLGQSESAAAIYAELIELAPQNDAVRAARDSIFGAATPGACPTESTHPSESCP